MEATLLSFRRGRHTQKMNQFLVEIEGCDSRAKGAQFIGKKLVWISTVKGKDNIPKKIFGIITHPHGNNGVLRARFSRGLPGEAVRTKVQIVDSASS